MGLTDEWVWRPSANIEVPGPILGQYHSLSQVDPARVHVNLE